MVHADHQSELDRLPPQAREVIGALLLRYEQQGVDEMADPTWLSFRPSPSLGHLQKSRPCSVDLTSGDGWSVMFKSGCTRLDF